MSDRHFQTRKYAFDNTRSTSKCKHRSDALARHCSNFLDKGFGKVISSSNDVS